MSGFVQAPGEDPIAFQLTFRNAQRGVDVVFDAGILKLAVVRFPVFDYGRDVPVFFPTRCFLVQVFSLNYSGEKVQ